MKNSFVLTALLIAQLLPSQTFGQVDSIATLNEQEKVLIKEAGINIKSAGQLYNVSAGLALGGSLLGATMIANDDAEGGLIVTTSTGLLASILQIVANTKLFKGGQELYLIDYNRQFSAGKSNLNSTKPKSRDRYTISKSELSLELKPTFSRRNSNWNNDVNQSLLGGANMRYSFNDNFIRLGVVTGITIRSNAVTNASYYVSRAGLIEMGKAYNKNELSIGVTVSQWTDFNFLNLSYSRDLTDKLGLGLDLRYDYAAYSDYSDYRWFPSVSLSYDVILKKS
jgi:hypothetical protein